MTKDKRHKTVKILIEGGHVTEFRQIFEHIPKTTVADDLGIHFNRIPKMITTVNDMKINDVFLFSSYFEIDAKIMFDLIYNQHNHKSGTRAKK